MAFASKRLSSVALLWLLAGVVVAVSSLNIFAFLRSSMQRKTHMSAYQAPSRAKTATAAWNDGSWNNGYQQSRYPITKVGEINAPAAAVGSASAVGLFCAAIGIANAPVALIGVAAVALAAGAAGRDGRFQKPINDFAKNLQDGKWRPEAGRRRWSDW